MPITKCLCPDCNRCVLFAKVVPSTHLRVLIWTFTNIWHSVPFRLLTYILVVTSLHLHPPRLTLAAVLYRNWQERLALTVVSLHAFSVSVEKRQNLWYFWFFFLNCFYLAFSYSPLLRGNCMRRALCNVQLIGTLSRCYVKGEATGRLEGAYTHFQHCPTTLRGWNV